MKRVLIILTTIFLIGCEEEPIKYTLTVSSNPTEGGTINPSSGEYQEGTEVTLRVNTNTNYEFDKWSGIWNGSESPLTITMDGDKNLVGNFKLMDSDGDGVTDDVDQCNDTPSGQTVDPNGCSDSQKDNDGDGVNDDLDNCPDTPNGETVDENGCIPNLYLDSNGVTIKSYEWGEVGDTGVINGTTYLIVSEDELREMISNGEDISNVCTSKVTNMIRLFRNTNTSPWSTFEINGDISSWDVSNVVNMNNMFSDSQFNLDISNWDVSNVTSMFQMFRSS